MQQAAANLIAIRKMLNSRVDQGILADTIEGVLNFHRELVAEMRKSTFVPLGRLSDFQISSR
jgi:hypothetical protein